MFESVCLVHYHEIGLKGKNRSTFENQLVTNLKRALRTFPVAGVSRISGYIVVETEDHRATKELQAAISQVPGVARVSRAYRCGLDQEEFFSAAVRALEEVKSFATFKVHARRSATNFPIHSIELNRMVGSVLCEHFPDKKVAMHAPDVTVVVHVIQGSTYVYADSIVGVGGLPVGTAGKVVSLLSSGIDSPVATWSEYLCQDIISTLEGAGIIGRLYVVPFGERQREISLTVPQSLRIIMYRRVMYQVSERIAQIEGASALVTGESLGQVASQTLDNIAAVNESVTIPILRPLIGSDKQEIIARAQAIGTFDISAQAADDCCTLFMPRRPETHARMREVLSAWNSFDHKAMVDDLVAQVEYRDFNQCPSYRPPKELSRFHKELLPRETA